MYMYTYITDTNKQISIVIQYPLWGKTGKVFSISKEIEQIIKNQEPAQHTKKSNSLPK